MPPIPIPDGADVPEWKRERKAGNGVTSCNAVREALLKVLRALDLDLSPEVVGTLRALEYHGPDYVDAVLRSLDDLVAGQ